MELDGGPRPRDRDVEEHQGYGIVEFSVELLQSHQVDGLELESLGVEQVRQVHPGDTEDRFRRWRSAFDPCVVVLQNLRPDVVFLFPQFEFGVLVEAVAHEPGSSRVGCEDAHCAVGVVLVEFRPGDDLTG